MWSSVVKCCQVLSSVVKCFQVLSSVFRCCQILSSVVICCQMLSSVVPVHPVFRLVHMRLHMGELVVVASHLWTDGNPFSAY